MERGGGRGEGRREKRGEEGDGRRERRGEEDEEGRERRRRGSKGLYFKRAGQDNVGQLTRMSVPTNLFWISATFLV